MIINDQGTVVTFTPEGDMEYEWLTLNVESEPWQWLGKTLVVDPRFASDLLDGVQGAGFVIERE